MTAGIGSEPEDRVVLGYFENSADADRAIDELMDEGFRVSEIGAAFCSPRKAVASSEGGKPRLGASNPEATGSIGGPASHDEAVTPAGLAPGSGNAFPSVARPGPIPGGEVPTTMPRTLRRDLPDRPVAEEESERSRRARREEIFGGMASRANPAEGSQPSEERRTTGSSGMKFGTGEGRLFGEQGYSGPGFENSFLDIGLNAREARSLSGELGRGGAVVSVHPGQRAPLAEGILERNHGRIRFEREAGVGAGQEARVEVYGWLRNYCETDYRPEERHRKKAS
jgi:hypothetical protein